nr:hypothetical protein [Tanacetum cinerariifolium]
MEREFLRQKDSGRGRGVKEKDLNGNKRNTTSSIGLSTESDDTMNDDTLVCVTSFGQEGVTPSVVDMTVVMEKQNYLDDTIVSKYFPPLSTQVTSTAGNAPGKSSYANITSKPSRKKVNVRTLFTLEGKGIDVVVLVDSICAISERFANTAYDNIVVALPKITREGHYTCNVRVEYEWKPPGCSSCKIYGHIHEESPNNSGAGEKKTVKKPSQTSRGVPVGPKISFKPQKEYRSVSKKTTASTSGIKKKGVEPTIEANRNPLVPTRIVESDSEVKVVFDDTANLMISTSCKDGSDKVYGTNILLEQ